MDDILFINFNLAACDCPMLESFVMLNVYLDFSFNIFSLRTTIVSDETLENGRWFK